MDCLCGDTGEGVMRGSPMISFVPLHLNALEQSETLKEWIQGWLGKAKEVEFLKEEGWFERGHDIVGGKENADGV